MSIRWICIDARVFLASLDDERYNDPISSGRRPLINAGIDLAI